MKEGFMKMLMLGLVAIGISLSAAESFANGGFGADNLFDSGIASPNLIARQACPALNVQRGDRLVIFAQESSFEISDVTQRTRPISLSVPQQARYVFQGQSPNRNSNEIIAPGVRVLMSTTTDDIQVSTYTGSCKLTRCLAFGSCM